MMACNDDSILLLCTSFGRHDFEFFATVSANYSISGVNVYDSNDYVGYAKTSWINRFISESQSILIMTIMYLYLNV